MKKLLALLLCAMLVIPSLALAVEYDPQNVRLDGTLPIVVDNSEMEALDIVVPQDALCTVDAADMKSLKMLAEDTGVKINFIGIPKANFTEQVNLMLASRDLPDVFWGNIDYSVVTQYMNQGIFMPTEDLIEKYCPIISDVLNSNPEYAALTTYPDGHRYGFPTIIESRGLVLTQGPFLINKTWLDKLGLNVPTNLDEFKQVLIAFRDAGDLNGNGEADEIPYAVNFVDSNAFATNNSLFYLMSCFGETGTYGDWYPYTKIGEDRKVKFSVLDDAFRKVLNFYHELYEENLLDLDGFAGDGKYQYKLQQDVATIGVFATWAPSNDIPVKDVYNQYVALPRLTGPEGAMGSVNNRSEVQQPSGFLITTECKYPEIAAAIANYMSIPKIAPQINYGVIGDMFVEDENGVLRYPIDEEGHFILPEGYETFAEVRANNTPAKNVIILSKYFDTVVDYAWDAVDLLEFQKQNGKEAILAEGNPTPPVIMTVEEQAIYSQLLPQIENIVKTFMVSSVLDGSADANWESFEQQLKDAGLDQMMAVIQSAYDRYLVTYDTYAEMMK